MTTDKALTHYTALAAEAAAFAAESARAAHVAPIVPADPLTDIDSVLDGDLICKQSAERMADALEARAEALDCNGNPRRYE